MTDVTELLLGFRKFVRDATQRLDDLGLRDEDEVWDDFIEAAFVLFVTRPVEAKGELSVDVVYDTWPPEGFSREIIVRPAPHSDLLVASPQQESRVGMHFRAVSEKNPVFAFAFRSFSNLLDPEAKPAEYAMGVVRDDSTGYEVGTQVCARADDCRFEV